MCGYIILHTCMWYLEGATEGAQKKNAVGTQGLLEMENESLQFTKQICLPNICQIEKIMRKILKMS